MLLTIKRFITPPVFPCDEDRTRTAQVLHALLANMLAVMLIAIIATIFVFIEKIISSMIIFFLLALILASSILTRRGQVKLASILFVVGMWIIFTLWLLLVGTISTTITGSYLALAVIAGLLLGKRFAVLIAVLSSIAGLVLAILQNAGYTLVHYLHPAPLPSWVVFVFAFLWTITPLNIALKSSAQALTRARKSEMRYATLFKEAPMMYLTVYELNGVPVISDCNATFLTTMGYTRDQVIGQPLSDFYTLQSKKAFLEEDNYHRILRNKSTVSAERDLMTQKGHIIHTLAGCAPDVDEAGQTIGLLVMFLDITDRKRAEKALKESEERYQRITEAITDYIYTVHVEKGSIVQTIHGPGCLAVTGYRAEEFEKDPFLWLNMVVIDDRSRVKEQAKEILTDATTQPIEHRIIRKNGTMRWVRNTFVPYYNTAGVLVSYDGLLQDITERKLIEEALHQQFHFQELLMNMSMKYIKLPFEEAELAIHDSLHEMGEFFSADRAGIYNFDLNKQIFNLTHRWEDKNLGPQTKKIMEELPLSSISNWMMETLYRNEPVFIQDVRSLPDDEMKNLLNKIGTRTFIAVPLVSSKKLIGFAHLDWIKKQYVFSGKEQYLLTLFANMYLNITERMETENALRESETKLRAVFENSRDAITVSKRGIRVFANPAFLKMFGITKGEELFGTSVLDNYAPSHHEQIKRNIKLRATGDKAPSFYETRGRKKDGTEFDIELNVSKYELLGEVYTLASIRDITERKYLEQEKYLMQEKVIQAAKMASLGLMVSGVGHEINNPNQVILSNLQYFAKALNNIVPILDEYYKAYGDFTVGGINFSEIGKKLTSIIADTITSSKRIKMIVDDLRSYSRKEDYKDAEQIDLNQITESSISLMRGMINSSTNNFIVEYNSETLMINANAQRVKQVLVNLIQNACQALPEKSAAIYIITGKQAESVFIRIRDEGIGMDSETLSNLKIPFFTTKRDRGGTGLGLFVSDNIIKAYGGTLTINSIKGKGTEITILFPEHDKEKLYAV